MITIIQTKNVTHVEFKKDINKTYVTFYFIGGGKFVTYLYDNKTEDIIRALRTQKFLQIQFD